MFGTVSPKPIPQFHLVISETHAYDLSIKVAQKLLEERASFGKVALCLETDGSDWATIKRIYTSKKDDSDFLVNLRVDYNQLKAFLLSAGNYQNADPVDRDIFEKLIYRNRVLAYFNLCQFIDNNNITVFGIDTRQNLPPNKTQLRGFRSQHMYSRLSNLHQQGYSTITVLGTGHVIDIRELNQQQNRIPNLNLVVIKIPGKMPIPNDVHSTVISRFQTIISPVESTEGLGPVSQEVNANPQGLEIISQNDPNKVKDIIFGKINPKKILKDKIFKDFLLDNSKDEKSELERGLRKDAFNARPEYIKDFIELDVDVNAQNSDKKTALHFAVEAANNPQKKNAAIETIKELLKYNAKFDIPDKNGKFAMDYANGDKAIKGIFPKTIINATFFRSPRSYPSLLTIYGVRENKATGPAVAKALKEILNTKEYGRDTALKVAKQFCAWAKEHNRYFNMQDIKTFNKENKSLKPT